MRRALLTQVLAAGRCFTSLPTLVKGKGAPATLPPLDFELADGVKPVLTAKQLNLHYNKHHKAYVDKLNALAGTQYDGCTIEEIVVKAAALPEQKVLFNQAAQHFNHSFFWKCLKPGGSPIPPAVATAIEGAFGSVDDFKKKFAESAINNFGSGWTWLVYNPATQALEITNTSNAGCPVVEGKIPLLTVDVWEHAYYVDFENRRPDYVADIWKVVNWEFVATQLAAVAKK